MAAVLGLAGWVGLAIAEEHEGAPAIALEGEILVVHIDYFERGKSEIVYHLRERQTGTVYELRFERAAPQSLRTGDKVSVTGRGLGPKVWVQDIAPGLQQDGAEESQVEEPTAAESPSAYDALQQQPHGSRVLEPVHEGQSIKEGFTAIPATMGFDGASPLTAR